MGGRQHTAAGMEGVLFCFVGSAGGRDERALEVVLLAQYSVVMILDS